MNGKVFKNDYICGFIKSVMYAHWATDLITTQIKLGTK